MSTRRLAQRNDQSNSLETSLWRLANFTPKQTEAWQALMDYDYLLYGGGRGGGKSYLLRWAMLLYLEKIYRTTGIKNVKVAIFCEDYPTLKDRQITWIESEFPSWCGSIKSTKSDGLGFHLHPDLGSGIILLRNLDKPDKYKSSQWAAIAVDELTQNPYEVFAKLLGSKRWPGLGFTKFIGTTNPGGIGHLWVKDAWIDRTFIGHPELKKKADQFHFVPALLDDNPYLPPEYRVELEMQEEKIKRAWLYGDWNVFEGQVFTEWNPDLHICRPFEIPDYWIRRRAIDWGWAKPWCCLWSATDPDTGRTFIYREAYGTGLTDERQAQIIKQHSEGEQFKVSFGDPSMWQRKNVMGIVSSAADEYSRGGVRLTAGDNDRMSGKRKVHRALANLPDGLPGLVVFDTCKNLIRTLPALPYDETYVEDIDSEAEDHAYDALRYLLSDLAKPSDLGDNSGLRMWERKAQAIAEHFK